MRSEEEVDVGVAAGLGVLVGAEVITTTVALLEGGVVALLFVEPQLAFQSTVVVGWVPVVSPTFTPAVLCTFCPGVGEGVDDLKPFDAKDYVEAII